MVAMAQQVSTGSQVRTGRNSIRVEDPGFYTTEEARRIGDQVLLWQRNTGGWPKNIDMAASLSDEQKATVIADKVRRDDSTTDNGATTMQMAYLARLYKATRDDRYRDAFRRGVEYLLSGQYANGGWPQFWPEMHGYQKHITYNDDAMVNTMLMLSDMYYAVPPYDSDLCDPAMKKSLRKAFDNGVECILATQMVLTDNGIVPAAKWNKKKQKGTLTVWCQQHDRETLMPAPARAYELPSYSSQESASIVRLLMQLQNPDKRVKDAVHAAMAWFDKYKLTGLKVVRTRENGVMDTRLVRDAAAQVPLWARYYDLENCLPYVCDRDGIPRRLLEDIGAERRNGYSWYGSRAAELYDVYDAWADKYDKENKIAISLDTKGANENGTLRLGVVPKPSADLFDAVVERGGSIQAAINKAPAAPADGDTAVSFSLDKPFKILIRKGVYNQKVVIDRPNIVLVGENRDSCIIVGAEAQSLRMPKEYAGSKSSNGILELTDDANDCVISGLTVINNYGTTVNPTTTHQFSVYGRATRTIIINSNIISDGNDALSLWGRGDDGKGGLYYHADLYVRCPGVDFICPRGTCYATRCRFLGDSRAILWHDGRGDKDNKFVVTNSEFDALKPAPLGRYHHDSQFYVVNCRLSKNIIDEDIAHAYKAQPELARGKTIDPCPWGHRVYYINCTREGGHSGWLSNNVGTGENAPTYYSTNAQWTFGGRWDPEKRIRDLWSVLAY